MINILVVDDEIEILENVCEILHEAFVERIKISSTSISRKAKEMLGANNYDILLTDIKMPVFNGLELGEYALNLNPKCKVLYLTSYNDFNYAYKALKQGCENYILKLGEDKEIVDAIGKVLNKIKDEERNNKLLSQAQKFRGEIIETSQDDSKNVNYIKNYISANLTKDLSLNNLAKIVYLHPTYLSRIFKEETGVTITECINQIRIEKAQELLINTMLSSKTIAKETGFESDIYFERVFKKITSKTPKEFRKMFANIE